MSVENRIIEELKKENYGLTISELAKRLKKSRITVRVRLEVLKERGILDFKKVGPAKLYYLKRT
jgi:DNA-binding transcriptional ArsR family regulator